MRGDGGLEDVATRAVARVGRPPGAQVRDGAVGVRRPGGTSGGRSAPSSRPRWPRRSAELGAALGAGRSPVEVVDAQQEARAGGAGEQPRQERGAEVAEVELARRGRRNRPTAMTDAATPRSPPGSTTGFGQDPTGCDGIRRGSHWGAGRPACENHPMTALPQGFSAHVDGIGIKDETDDFLVLAADRTGPAAAVFTRSRFVETERHPQPGERGRRSPPRHRGGVEERQRGDGPSGHPGRHRARRRGGRRAGLRPGRRARRRPPGSSVGPIRWTTSARSSRRWRCRSRLPRPSRPPPP